MSNRQTENWKDIPGHEGRYEVSDLGRVRNAVTGYVLKTGKGWGGYTHIVLGINKKTKKNYTVHRLVAMAFLNVTSSSQTVTHIDFNKSNNAVGNLEVQPFRKIMKRASGCGLLSKPLNKRGEGNHNAKLTEAAVREIREMAGIISQREMARRLGVSSFVVNQAARRLSWTHI